MKRAAFAKINLAHLKHNLAIIKKFANQSKLMAVVKADAYGHGVIQVCKTLKNTDAFSVAFVNEALELRDNGIKNSLVALQGFSTEEDLKSAVKHDIQVVIHHKEQLRILKNVGVMEPLNVFLKVDTGMHRLGFSVTEFNSVLAEVKSLLPPASKLRLMTHFASADELESQVTQDQLNIFFNLANEHPYEQSIANSAGILAWPNSHCDWVRPGLALYGVNPVNKHDLSADVNLRPVMSLHAPLISIKQCKKGEKVGYGGDFCCPKDMLIGIIAIGYADGYPRHLEIAPSVGIGEHKAPVVGRVSMDMIAVNLDGIDTQVGEVVELWGALISVTEVAECAGTISYELLCAAGNSVYKQYIQ